MIRFKSIEADINVRFLCSCKAKIVYTYMYDQLLNDTDTYIEGSIIEPCKEHKSISDIDINWRQIIEELADEIKCDTEKLFEFENGELYIPEKLDTYTNQLEKVS